MREKECVRVFVKWCGSSRQERYRSEKGRKNKHEGANETKKEHSLFRFFFSLLLVHSANLYRVCGMRIHRR